MKKLSKKNITTYSFIFLTIGLISCLIFIVPTFNRLIAKNNNKADAMDFSDCMYKFKIEYHHQDSIHFRNLSDHKSTFLHEDEVHTYIAGNDFKHSQCIYFYVNDKVKDDDVERMHKYFSQKGLKMRVVN